MVNENILCNQAFKAGNGGANAIIIIFKIAAAEHFIEAPYPIDDRTAGHKAKTDNTETFGSLSAVLISLLFCESMHLFHVFVWDIALSTVARTHGLTWVPPGPLPGDHEIPPTCAKATRPLPRYHC